jgi:hypothetical protein
MASIIFDGIVAEARGALGTNVFSRNQYGAYVKTRVTPTNPSTAAQEDWRARLAQAVATWGSLSQDQRNMYHAQAKHFRVKDRLGRQTKINGYNLFIRQQLIISKAGNQDTVSNPVATLVDSFRIDFLELTTTSFLLNTVAETVPGNTRLTVKASPGRPASHQSFNPATCVLIIESEAVAAGNQVVDITDAYETRFGAIAGLAGQWVTIGIQTFDVITGQHTTDQFESQIVTV